MATATVRVLIARVWVYQGYLRALLLNLRGASIGPKTRIDRFFYAENVACLRTGERAVIEQNVTIKIVTKEASVLLGERVFVGRNSTLDISERLVVGDRSLIAPGCFITDHNHSIACHSRIVDQGIQSSAVEIGHDVWIGANACILPGVRIGDGAVIGAGAVVTKDVPANCVAIGVPARVMRERN